MKKLVFLLVITLISTGIHAQVLTSTPSNDDEFKTIFDGEDFKIGAFGGPMMTFTTIDNQFSHMMGGGGGIIIGGFYFGGYGMGLTNSIGANEIYDPDYIIKFGHGGFMTGVTIGSNKAIHPVINTLIGWGSVSIKPDFNHYESNSTNNTDPVDEEYEYFIDGVFVFEPSLELEMNFTRFFRVAVGCGYRLVSSLDLEAYTSEDFSGVSGSLSLKFGWF